VEIAILCYHGFSETWPAPTTVTPARLERQLAWLAKRGYRSATLSEALSDPPSDRTLVLTFDDAHRSVIGSAAPLLAEHGFVGTVFAPTDYVDSGKPMGWDGYDIWLGTPHEGELAPLSWEQLGGLVEAGWEVGSHTLSHPHLPAVADDERLGAELGDSRRRCEERLGVPCPTLAYPYGEHDARVRRAAAAAGYTVAVTMPQAAEPPLPLAWPRVGVYRDDDVRRLGLRMWRRALPFRSRLGSRVLERALALRGG
jgi:peptidoglycan/xylan/chitin deacetylase (PgdA/CDA1 family)